MLRTALGTKGLTVGVALLALVMPPVMAAQLPDAPLPVSTRQFADASFSNGADFDVSNNSLEAPWERGWLPTWNPYVTRPWGSGAFASAPAWWSAFDGEAVAKGQESLYNPQKETVTHGFSSSIAERRPIPGDAPALHNACPNDACSLAEGIMCCGTAPSPFERYLKSPDAVPLTARDNLRSAVRHVIDPFNLMTIGADAAIGVASDSHSVYGSGVMGIAKYAGVSLTEDMTGEFFGTFVVPSLVHQDPHYHREPFVSIKRRILHTITQVVWTQSYTGRPMLNYANIFGGIATAVVSNTFVPGPGRQGFKNTSERLAVAFAISPSGNVIEEFVPDIANRINLRVVIFQRILNTVSIEESGVP